MGQRGVQAHPADLLVQPGPGGLGQRAQGAFEERGLGDDVVGGARGDVRDGQHRGLVGVDAPGECHLQRSDHRRRGGNGVERVVRGRRVAPAPGDGHAHDVGRGHDRTVAGLQLTGRHGRGDVQRKGDVGAPGGARLVQQPLLDHVARPVEALLAGLEHEQHPSGEGVAVVGEHAGGRSEHGDVRVVPAGVHRPVDLGGEIQPGVLVEREGVHVAAQQHGGPRPRALQHRDDGRHRTAQVHLQREIAQLGEERVAGVRQGEAQLRTAMERAPQRHSARLHVPRSDAQTRKREVDPGHRPIVAPLACGVRVNFPLWFGPQSVVGLP